MKYFQMFFVVLIIFLYSFTATADPSDIFNSEGRPERGQGKNEAKWRAYFSGLRTEHGFDAKYYDAHIAIEPGVPHPDSLWLDGTNNITAISTEDGLQEIQLDLVGLNVSTITMDGAGLTFDHQDGILTIELGTSFNEGDEFTVSINYYGAPSAETGEFGGDGIFYFPEHQEISTQGEMVGARQWLPCFDDPSDKVDSLSLHFTLPSEWKVYSNGLLRGIDDNGTTRTHNWHTNYPTSTYLFAFVASPDYEVYELEYTTQEGGIMPVPNYVFSDQLDEAAVNLADVPFMIETLSDLFGEYPFVEEKYGQAAFHIFFGGMENQTITFLHVNWINNRLTSLYVHELGHQWWGDAITLETWADTWLNEGFATYCEVLYFESISGDYRPYLLGNLLEQYLNVNYEHPIYDPPPGFLFSTIVYEKGGLVLHTLRGVVGDEVFFNILREYYSRHEYSTATTADFQQACEDVSGMDLDWFFDEWIYDDGRPIFDVKWDSWQNTDETYTIEASFTQTQASEGWGLFQMPTEAGAVYEGVDNYELTQFQIDSTPSTYVSMTVSEEPLDFAFDPWEWFVIKEYEIETIDKFSVGTITINDDDNDELLEQGESAQLIFGLQNNLFQADNVSALLSTNDPAVEITDDSAIFGNIGSGEIMPNENDPFAITVANDITPHTVTFELTLGWDDGHATTISVELYLGPAADVLLVDDDSGANYEQSYQNSMTTLNVDFQTRDWTVFGTPTRENLNNFPVVIWYTGDDLENSLTEADQAVLTDYLNDGGNLFLTGQGIGVDIADSDFFTNYIHAGLRPDDQTGTILRGIDGDPISHGLTITMFGSNQDHLTAIEPLGAAEPVFNYFPMGGCGAIRYEGGYKVVYFGFGFEGVIPQGIGVTPEDLMWRVLAYLDNGVGIESDPTTVQVPTRFSLSQNHPNPFNPKTQISYRLPTTCDVNLAIYDLSGRLVKRWAISEQIAGEYSIMWDGTNGDGNNVSSGIYIYRLQAGDFVDSRRMTLLK